MKVLRLFLISIVMLLNGCYATMQQPIKLAGTTEIYVNKLLPEGLSLPLNASHIKGSSVFYQTSLLNRNGKVDTVIFIGSAGNPVSSSASRNVSHSEIKEKLDNLAQYNLKASLDRILSATEGSRKLPSKLRHTLTKSRFPHYEIRPYLYAFVGGMDNVELLVVMNVAYFESSEKVTWSGQYIRHAYPLLSMQEVTNQKKIQQLIESGFSDLLKVFTSDLDGLVVKSSDTKISPLTVAPLPKDTLSVFGQLVGWELQTPHKDIYAVLSRDPSYAIYGGMHIFTQGIMKAQPVYPQRPPVKHTD